MDYLENVGCREDPIGLLRECGQRIQNKDYHYRKSMDRESSCIVIRRRCIVLVLRRQIQCGRRVVRILIKIKTIAGFDKKSDSS